jgi:sugar lactone lactonase YvrE
MNLKISTLSCASVLLLVMAIRCGGYTAPAVPPPAITSFTAAKSPITAGTTTTLIPEFGNGLGTVDQGVGPVSDGVPVVVKPTATTTYTLTDSDAGGASETLSATVQVVPAPTAVITVAAAVEPSLAGQQASVAAQAGCAYAWTINAEGGTITAGADGPTVTFTTAASGDLTLTCAVTNAAGTTETSAPLTLSLGGPEVTDFVADPEVIPAGSSSTLTFTFSGGTAVISSPGNPDLPVSLGSTSVIVTPAVTTTYTFTVTDHLGQPFTATATVTVLPEPTITSFAASPGPGIIGTGAGTELVAAFDAGPDGTATVDNGVGSVESGVPVATGELQHSTVFTLTVANAAGVQAPPATVRVLVGALAPLAGTPSGEGSQDGTLAAARYRAPAGMALDPASGNLYVLDSASSTLRQISPEGEVTTVAGLEGVPGSADGTGAEARFNHPLGLAVAPDGILFVADSGSNTIRTVDPGAGTVTTVAGSAIDPAGAANGEGPAARFNHPTGIEVNGDGTTVYVSDTGNHTIRAIDLGAGPYAVTTLTGDPGVPGNQDGDPSTPAQFNAPAGLVLGPGGVLYVADANNNSVRRVDLGGGVTTLAGGGPDAAGSMDGSFADARFSNPQGITADPLGNTPYLYLTDTGNSTLRTLSLSDGSVATLDGTAGLTGTSNGTAALFNGPMGLAFGHGGNLYVADTGNATLREIPGLPEPGPVATYSGTPGSQGAQNGPGPAATLRQPRGAVLGASGNLYVADSGNHTIRKIAPGGTVSTLAGTAGSSGFLDGPGLAGALFNQPTAVAAGVDANGSDIVYVADTGNDAIRKVAADGTVSTLAGTGQPGAVDSASGPPQFNRPAGVALDASGNVLVADQGNNTLRQIAAANGAVTTLAGTAGVKGSADGAAGPEVSFNAPAGLAVAKNGTLYVADYGNHTIRQLAAGQVSTLAGMAGNPGSVDGNGTAAQLNGPTGIALDTAGNLYVTNNGSSTVCVITPVSGAAVTTIMGSATVSGDVPGPLPAQLPPPYGIAVDPATGNIFITIDDAIMTVDFTK